MNQVSCNKQDLKGVNMASLITFKIMVEGGPFDLIDEIDATIEKTRALVLDKSWSVEGGLDRTTVKPAPKPRKSVPREVKDALKEVQASTLKTLAQMQQTGGGFR
jgi:hypothetical protein